MMSERPNNEQKDDHSKTILGPGAITEIKLVGFDRPFFTAAALAISIMAAFYAFETGREMAQDVYWKQRTEAFLELLATQGYKVPPDLLPSKGR